MRSIDGWATLVGQAASDWDRLGASLILLCLLLAALGALVALTFVRWIFRRWVKDSARLPSRRSRPENRQADESPWQVAGRRAKPIDLGETGAGRGEGGSSDG